MLEIGPIWDENGMGSPLSIAVWSIVLLTIITVVIFALRLLRARTNRNWQEAATELGLNFTPRQLFWLPYEMNGTLDGGYFCRVHTWTERTSYAGESDSQTMTGFEVRFLESLGMGLTISPSHGIKWLNSLLGDEDLEVGGDSDFDKQFKINCTDELKLQRFLTAERKEILKRAFTFNFEMNDVGISSDSADVTRDKETIVHVVMELKNLAMALTSDGGEQEPDIFARPSISEDSKSIFD